MPSHEGLNPMNAILVREPVSEDTTELTEVDRLATADLRKVYRPTALALEHRALINPNLQRLIAVLEGRVVGAVQYHIKGERLSFLGLGVHPDFRLRGIATAIVQNLEKIGRLRDCKAMVLHTVRETGNVGIFERMGFEVESQMPTLLFESETASTLHEVVMVKEIS
jgi:ribosomal protein S18 acetylase RimI-like enzyme